VPRDDHLVVRVAEGEVDALGVQGADGGRRRAAEKERREREAREDRHRGARGRVPRRVREKTPAF
jgi:hypothetical protein